MRKNVDLSASLIILSFSRFVNNKPWQILLPGFKITCSNIEINLGQLIKTKFSPQ